MKLQSTIHWNTIASEKRNAYRNIVMSTSKRKPTYEQGRAHKMLSENKQKCNSIEHFIRLIICKLKGKHKEKPNSGAIKIHIKKESNACRLQGFGCSKRLHSILTVVFLIRRRGTETWNNFCNFRILLSHKAYE